LTITKDPIDLKSKRGSLNVFFPVQLSIGWAFNNFTTWRPSCVSDVAMCIYIGQQLYSRYLDRLIVVCTGPINHDNSLRMLASPWVKNEAIKAVNHFHQHLHSAVAILWPRTVAKCICIRNSGLPQAAAIATATIWGPCNCNCRLAEKRSISCEELPRDKGFRNSAR